MKSGNLNFLEPSGPLQAYNGTDLPFTLQFAWWDWKERQNLSQDIQSVNSDFSMVPHKCEASVLSMSVVISDQESASVQPLHFTYSMIVL